MDGKGVRLLVPAALLWGCACGSGRDADASKTAEETTATATEKRDPSACPDGATKYEYRLEGSNQVEGCRRDDGSFDGPYAVELPDGVKILEGTFERGKKSGTWIYRHPNGNTWRQGAYRDGVRHGAWQQFDPDGKLLGEFSMDDGSGVETMWWDNSKPRRTSRYEGGVRSGPTTTYFETGEKMTVAHYKDHELHGEWTFYDRKGQIRKVETWEQGAIRNTVWYKDGVPLTQ